MSLALAPFQILPVTSGTPHRGPGPGGPLETLLFAALGLASAVLVVLAAHG